MLKLSFKTTGFDAVKRHLEDVAKQQRYAAARALTKTARDLDKTVATQTMPAKLDRPTRFPLTAGRVMPATKQDLRATYFIRDNGERSPAALLIQQFAGGARAPKRFEVLLRQQGYLGAGEFVMPGRGAELDKFGNVSRSLLTRILQAIKAKPTKATKRKRAAVKGGAIFWASGKTGLAKGAWQKAGSELRCLLLVTGAPTYRRRINLGDVAQQVVRERFSQNFQTALADALRTAR